MSKSEMTTLFGGPITTQGQRINGSLGRQMQRSLDEVAVQSEIDLATEQRSLFHHMAVANNAMLFYRVIQSGTADIPEVAPLLAPVFQSYIQSGAYRASRS